MKNEKREIKWLARNSKAKVIDWTRRLVAEVDAAEPAKAERLMRLMQNLASRCNTLDKQWAKIVEGK